MNRALRNHAGMSKKAKGKIGKGRGEDLITYLWEPLLAILQQCQ